MPAPLPCEVGEGLVEARPGQASVRGQTALMSDVLGGPGEVPACPGVSPCPACHTGQPPAERVIPRGSGVLISDARASEGANAPVNHTSMLGYH